MPIYVETLESDSSMLLLSELEPGSVDHISDFFVNILLNPSIREDFKIDERRSFATAMQEGSVAPSRLAEKTHVWAPGPDSIGPEDTSIGYQSGTGVFQFSHITRRIVKLQDWGDVRIGYLKDIPIRRRNIICYVANKLGGVHYDSKRTPRDGASAREFTVLASAYDWEAQAVMHAGLVSIALACIELVRVTALMDLYTALEEFHSKRQKRLVAGLSLPTE